MAARNKPAGIRSLVYGIGKGKVRIEGLSVSGVYLSVGLDQLEGGIRSGLPPVPDSKASFKTVAQIS